MSAYTFNDRHRAITITRPDLPSPWINYLSNGRLHAFVSQAAGGFVWLENSVRCRLTRYRMHHLPVDSPGFYVYIRHQDGSIWSPGFRPSMTRLDAFSATHEPGATTFVAARGDWQARLRLFITPDYNALTWDLEITNATGRDETVDVFAYVEFSQLDWANENSYGYYWRHMLKTWYDEDAGTLFYLFHHLKQLAGNERSPLVYFHSSRPVTSFSGDRDAFIGNYGDERTPLAVLNGRCGNEEILSGEPCGALHVQLSCRSGQPENTIFILGAEPGAPPDISVPKQAIARAIHDLNTPGILQEQFLKMKQWWNRRLDVAICAIPDENAQRQINIWGPVNCVQVSIFERAVNTLAPGVRTIGFRDSCQDMLCMSYRDAPKAEAIFLKLLALQEEAGNARSHLPEPRVRKKPDVGIQCDNHLWLPLLAYALVAETGSTGILHQDVPFWTADPQSPGKMVSAWQHLLAGIRFTENHLGNHGLPLTLSGDWNDIIGKFSRQGRGESVFAAQQYVVALGKLIEIAQLMGRSADGDWLEGLREKQVQAILNSAWNGKWWYRCFDDAGKPVGDEHSAFGKIWLNSQSWAVMSGVGSPEQLRQGMAAAATFLSTDCGLMKLFPGFKTWPDEADPFSGYNPGNGENGAIFCHSNTWAVIAEALLGNAEQAWKYYNQLVPHNALQKMGLERYKSEPYAWASNIVGVENPKHGWSNVVHITGTATWMDVAANQYLLGFRPALTGVTIDPCVPGWTEFSLQRTYRGCRLNLAFTNPERVHKGVRSMTVDGVAVPDAFIPASILENKTSAHVAVVMG